MAVVQNRKTRDDSDLTTLYLDEDAGPPYSVRFDEWFTRRKKFHCILDKQGGVVFRSRSVLDIHDWLEAKECLTYLALGGRIPWLVTMARPST